MSADTKIILGLLDATVALSELPHSGQVGRVMLAAAAAGNGCTDDAIALTASLPVSVVREIIPTMLERCLHVPPLLTAKRNDHRMGVSYSGIRLTGEGNRRIFKLRDYLTRQ